MTQFSSIPRHLALVQPLTTIQIIPAAIPPTGGYNCNLFLLRILPKSYRHTTVHHVLLWERCGTQRVRRVCKAFLRSKSHFPDWSALTSSRNNQNNWPLFHRFLQQIHLHCGHKTVFCRLLPYINLKISHKNTTFLNVAPLSAFRRNRSMQTA